MTVAAGFPNRRAGERSDSGPFVVRFCRRKAFRKKCGSPCGDVGISVPDPVTFLSTIRFIRTNLKDFMTMKRMWVLLCGLWLVSPLSAQRNDIFADGYYDEYFAGGYDDIYRYGFMIDNYAASCTDRFVIEISREYGVTRADLRYYIRKGFAPSDLLFGLELSRRSGCELRLVMDRYYRNRNHDWIDVSVALGIGRASTGFRSIVDRFRYHCRHWGDYYVRHHPDRVHPPVYNHAWSYFRPKAPLPASRVSSRPAPAQRPSVVSGRPRSESSSGARTGSSYRASGTDRASVPSRPQRSGPSLSERRQQVSLPQRSADHESERTSEKSNSQYRREVRRQDKSSSDGTSDRAGYRRR